MLRDHLLAFDDYLAGNSDTLTTAAYDRSSDALCQQLASCDQVGVFVVLEEQSGATGALSLRIEHSGDGIDFVDKGSGVKIIDAATWAANATTVIWGYDDGSVPTLSYVRLVVWGSGTQAAALRVKVYVALRDLDELRAPETSKTSHGSKAVDQAAAKQQAHEAQAQEHATGSRGQSPTRAPEPGAD